MRVHRSGLPAARPSGSGSVPALARALPALALLGLALPGCDSGGGLELFSSMEVRMTATPSSALASAQLYVSRAYLEGGVDLGAGTVELVGPGGGVSGEDLQALGAPIEVTGPVALNPGVYPTLRVVVDSLRVTLPNGSSFTDGSQSRTLIPAGGGGAGAAVLLTSALDAPGARLLSLVVDFDLAGSLTIQGTVGVPEGISGITLEPRILEVSREVLEGQGIGPEPEP